MEEQIVVFIDLLGFRERMIAAGQDREKSAKLLAEYNKVMSEALQVLEESDGLFQYRGFTDNFVLACPLRRGMHPETRFGTIITEISYFQLHLAMNGWFVRGGIALGPFFMDQRIVFGPALVEAYELESSQARDPRIVLSDECKKWVRSFLEFYTSKHEAPESNFFLNSPDKKGVQVEARSGLPERGIGSHT